MSAGICFHPALNKRVVQEVLPCCGFDRDILLIPSVLGVRLVGEAVLALDHLRQERLETPTVYTVPIARYCNVEDLCTGQAAMNQYTGFGKDRQVTAVINIAPPQMKSRGTVSRSVRATVIVK